MRGGLSPSEERDIARKLRTESGRRSIRDSIGAAAADERAAWIWGRKLGKLEIGTVDAPPQFVAEICTIETTWYRAAKGKGAPLELYYHHHARPFQVLCGPKGKGYLALRSTRDVTLPRGPDLAVLGRLVQIDGHDSKGRRVEVQLRAGVLLLGEPRIHRMLIGGAPLWVARAGSPCRVTPDGLVE